MNNTEFIDGLRKQDPVAAAHLNECFVPSVWRFVYFRVDGDQHVAEDIVSEAVLALVAAAAAEAAIEHPAAWLRTVALRRIQDHFRAIARVRHLIEQAQPQVTFNDQDPAAIHEQKLKCQSVRKAVDSLPEPYGTALEWKYVDQLSVRVIADRLDTTEKSVESILFRARRALRSQLQSEGPEPHQHQPLAKESTAPTSPDSSEPLSEPKANSSDSSSQRASMLLSSRLARET